LTKSETELQKAEKRLSKIIDQSETSKDKKPFIIGGIVVGIVVLFSIFIIRKTKRTKN
jgi:hypothetical protein